jgi:hypothetical protein
MLAELPSLLGFEVLVEQFGCRFQGVIFQALFRRETNRNNAFRLSGRPFDIVDLVSNSIIFSSIKAKNLTFGGSDMSVVCVPEYFCSCVWRIMMLRIKKENIPRLGSLSSVSPRR